MDHELNRDLGRVEGKLDALILQLTEHIKKDEEAWNKMTQLEGKMMWAAGIMATVVFFVTSGVLSALKKMGLV